jgi:hypothetical protein
VEGTASFGTASRKDVRGMLKRLFLIFAVVALLATTADAVTVRRGIKGRKYLRRLSLVDNLQGDKLRVYEEYGFPLHRLRVEEYGRILEHWTYYRYGVEFVFDENQNLLQTNKFWPEDRRERFERYPGY